MLRPTSRRVTWPLSYRRLMAESEGLIDHTGRAGTPEQKAITRPLIEDIKRYCRWERRHSGLMHTVADAGSRPGQICGLRDIIITLIHQGALFGYMKERQLRGRDRDLLIRAFHPWSDYRQAVIEEHSNYVRSQSSSLCARYLATKLGDDALLDWYGGYHELFDDYFELFCDTVIAEGTGEILSYAPLLRDRKAVVMAERRRILDRVWIPGNWTSSLVPKALGIR